MADSAEQQLYDMASKESDPELKELLMRTLCAKMVAGCFRETKNNEES